MYARPLEYRRSRNESRMLKRLELLGFKSFADKTEFDFSQGITAIVGPNGSGKSNIVDAVRWVLGEQSPRSLRGGEMTDVIFNGSATRKSLGMAEVSLIFDNAKKIFPIEAAEVQVGRRVYANAEAEYIINKQVCRLKDVKDLFMGSGAGNDAYCIIEQGKVDSLLQSSAKDRRIIFEEASGISRFKARKVESLRRLERVTQNLERLKDILDEVENRLRIVRLQAAKAQKWKEFSDRLKELRLGLSLQEYSQLTENLEAEHVKLAELKADLEQNLSATTDLEKSIQDLEQKVREFDEGIHHQESSLTRARERIAAGDASLRHGRSRAVSLELESLQAVKILQDQEGRLSYLLEQFKQLRDAEARLVFVRQEQETLVSAMEEEEKQAQEKEKELRLTFEAKKVAHLDAMRNLAKVENTISASRGALESLAREINKLKLRSDMAISHLAVIDSTLGELAVADEVLQIRLAAARTTLADLGKEREELEGEKDRLSTVLAELQSGRSGVVTRIEVLEGLEKNLEGLEAGPKEALELAKGENTGPWGSILGMAAGLIEVSSEFALLIDLALGVRAQRLVAQNPDGIIDLLSTRESKLSGRISLQGSKTQGWDDLPDLTSFQENIVGWAWELAKCSHPDYPNLIRILLNNTLIVKDQSTARHLANSFPTLRLITLHGEILEPDGTFTTGPHHAETRFLSRKAELKDLQVSLTKIEDSLLKVSQDQLEVKTRVRENESRLEAQRRDIEVLAEQLTDLRGRIGMEKQKKEGLDEELKLSGKEIQSVQDLLSKDESELQIALEQKQELENICLNLVKELADLEKQTREGETENANRVGLLTQGKIALAQMGERATAATQRVNDLEREVDSREMEVRQARTTLQDCKTNYEDTSLSLLNTTSEMATWQLKKETAEKKLRELSTARAEAFLSKEEFSTKVQADRAHWRNRQELVHGRELAVNDLQVRRNSLCDRLRDDYQVEISELYQSKTADQSPELSFPPLLDGLVVTEEIAELRKKIQRLGSVNLESLEELATLETRHNSLKVQYDDLIAARKALEEILARINNDSKAMFLETLGNVRGHFQDLFRKLFGGGMADILLEDEQDVLECGIEIKARPPGKELRSISLMSGGEKTMTAVALLLAIFKNKPSPFCLLDEVDAALDEANINRFTEVLREFLDKSQFILITHSKRTMGCADVLYGVTMQESGISRRMAIRFQDWPNEEKKQDEPAA